MNFLYRNMDVVVMSWTLVVSLVFFISLVSYSCGVSTIFHPLEDMLVLFPLFDGPYPFLSLSLTFC